MQDTLPHKEDIKEIYDTYYNALVTYAKSYVTRTDVAQDLVQEAFIRLWEKDALQLPTELMRSYIYTTVRNLSLDYLKHQDVESRYAQRYADESAEREEIDENIEKEVLELIFQQIDRLPKRCREIFLMYLDGMNSTEIADQLALSIDTVRTQKKRAMQSLRTYFQEHPSINKSFYFIFFKILYPI